MVLPVLSKNELENELENYLEKVEDMAREFLERLIDKSISENPIKISDPFQKAMYMMNLKESLEELVYQEYVYKIHVEF